GRPSHQELQLRRRRTTPGCRGLGERRPPAGRRLTPQAHTTGATALRHHHRAVAMVAFGVAGGVLDRLPSTTETLHRFDEFVGRSGPRDADKTVEPAADREHWARSDDHSEPLGNRRELTGAWLREFAPQAHAAARQSK